jgi:hypothetical protein
MIEIKVFIIISYFCTNKTCCAFRKKQKIDCSFDKKSYI